MRGGQLIGVELLGVDQRRWEKVERFSEEFNVVHEVPLLGIELDDANTHARVDRSAIDQPAEFSSRWASSQRILEIGFDDFYSASDFGCGLAIYNRHGQLAGVRVRFPNE